MENEDTMPENTEAAQEKGLSKNRVFEAGESFGNYRVVKCLRAGLIAHYYHMQHLRDRHDVTVGIFHSRTEGDEEFLKRLQGLQQVMSAVDHEALPKIRDCTVINGRTCIFLDPIEGQALSQYYAAHKEPNRDGMSPEATALILAQLLSALSYAHSKGMDHRDLESDFVYVQEDGSIRILGFGIKATLGVDLFELIVSASVSPLESNKSQDRLNSFDIMSPEYKAGVAEDYRVDVYAVGFIGYWLLTGHKPDLAKYELPSKYGEDISPLWDNFFTMMIERVRDKRYQSCRIALLALKGINEQPESESVSLIQRQMARIPVPKKIVQRGESSTHIFRLCIIGLIGLTLTVMCTLFLRVSSTKEAAYSREVVPQLASSEKNTALELRLKPQGAKVEFLNYKQSLIANDEVLNLALQPGNYQLRLSAPQYVTQVLEVSIPAEMSAPESINVELQSAWTDIAIDTEPRAVVSIIDTKGDEVLKVVADEAGTFSLEKAILPGTYQVSVKKEGYQPSTLENYAIEAGTLAEINAPLKPLPATVSVVTRPEGASIIINGIGLGTTPLELGDFIPKDQNSVVAQLEGYRSIDRQVEIKPGGDTTIDFGQLVPLSGALNIAISVAGEKAPPPSALHDELQVFLDKRSVPYGDKALDSVPVGEYRIHLEHPLYISEDQTLEVEDQWTYALDFIMNPRPGFIEFEIPGNMKAEVRIDGEPVRLKNKQVQVPSGQELEFELRIRNYLTMVRKFTLSPAEIHVWNVDPVAIPGPTAGEKWTLPYLGIPFAWVPPGEFQMGSPLPEHARLPNEGPQTSVRFTRGFWGGVHEVSQSQYSEIMGQNPSEFKNAAHPVESVSWEDAKVFCSLLTNLERDAGRLPEGYVYRLPTEAEWEYAARAGTSTPFSFGSRADASLGNFRGVYPRDRQDGLRAPEGYGTLPGGRYEANANGLFDLHGNVREWTLDRYNGRLAGDSQVDPRPRQEGSRITVRGGGWEDPAARVRSAARAEVSPDVTSNSLGFRLVLAPQL